MAEQYRTPANLEARIALHERFSVNREPFHRWLFERLELPRTARLLELGCGSGLFWAKNEGRVPAGWQVTLTDLSKGMLAAAREAVRGLPATFAFQEADAAALPFADASFDAVMANHMLYHVPDDLAALREARRALVPGGAFYAATNGVTHMQELDELIAEHLATVAFERLSLENFLLETGEERLRQMFDQVTLHTYPDALEVTEAEPLVAYALSMRRTQAAAAPEEAVSAFREALEQRLKHGPIRITKATGLFVAR
jgi:ubiquinone/menaquinone biosynthesis C-methylase UbiE